ncbi:MAG: hypothetical protein GKS02_03110 [Alphaproteobacteria bacterium]|nr:hypothetical protein [Alphaproteobacteria bacterium]
MVLELLQKAIELAANPFALVGYIGLGVYSQTLWRALKYGFLWGAAIFIFSLALGSPQPLQFDALAVRFALQLAGAIIITVGIFYLYRMLLKGKGGGGSTPTNGSRKPPPKLRRVK